MHDGVEVLLPFERVVNDLSGGGTDEERELAQAVSERLLALRMKLSGGDARDAAGARAELDELALALRDLAHGPAARNTILSIVTRWRAADVARARALQDATVMGLRGWSGPAVSVPASPAVRAWLGVGLIVAGLLLRYAPEGS